GGMLYTTQCHQPLPVGASGSCISNAKLWVPAGAPLQASAGETFPPLQPNSLKTWVLASVSPSVKSVLVRVNFGMAPVSWAVGAAASNVVAARASAATDTCVLYSAGLTPVTPPTGTSRQKRPTRCSVQRAGGQCKSASVGYAQARDRASHASSDRVPCASRYQPGASCAQPSGSRAAEPASSRDARRSGCSPRTTHRAPRNSRGRVLRPPLRSAPVAGLHRRPRRH